MESRATRGDDGAILVDGRYRVEGLLGEGGMASVYAVVDLRSGQELALKRLLANAQPTAIALFKREYHTLIQLQHPCIVRAMDYGMDQGGPYFTMERLGGQDLRKVAPLPWRETCGILRDLASALAIVHSRRLLHRDVNHKNVRHIPGERARLLDFGALSSFGVPAERVGMAPFMPPEAFHGQPLGPRSDLYALGGVAYWLLTGKLAYDAVRPDELPGLWQRPVSGPAALGVPLPETLDRLIMQLLRLEPLARVASAAEVIDQLAEIAGLERGDPHQAARSYLANPRLAGRTRERERLERVLRAGLKPKSPSDQAASARTGGFAPVGVRATSRLRRGTRADARRSSESLLWVSGPAGVGRTRVLHELALQAKFHGARVGWVSASQPGRAHAGLRALVDDILGREPELASGLDAGALHLIEELLPKPGRRSDPPGVAGLSLARDQRPRLHVAIVDWLMAIAAKRGLVVIVDDVQRLDEDSATFFAAFAARVEEGRVLLAISATPGLGEVPRDLASVTERSTPLDLAGLDADATLDLVTSVFGEVTHLRRVSGWVHQLSGGNPLHCMQLVGHLVDTGLARYDRGGWQLPHDPEVEGLPEGLEGVYASRVDALSETAHALGRILALHESPVAVERIALLLPEHDATTLFGALEELTSAGVATIDGLTYRIAHQPLVEALTGRTTDAERAATHRRIGETLLAQGLTEMEETFDAAYHLLHGGAVGPGLELVVRLARQMEFVPAIGPRSCVLLERALELADGRPPAVGLRIRLALVISGTFYDSTHLRHADGVLRELRELSGVACASGLDPGLPSGQRMRLALGMISARQPAGVAEHAMDPREALGHLCTLILYLVRVHASRAEVARLRALLETTEVMTGLAPACDLVHENVLAAIDGLTGHARASHQRFVRVIDGIEILIERAAGSQGRAPLLRWRSTLLAIVGSAVLYSDSTESLRWADLAEQAGALIPAWSLRQLAGLYRMDAAMVESATRQLDALSPASLEGWEHGGWFLPALGGILYLLGDAPGLKEATVNLEKVTRSHAGYLPWLEVQRGNLACLRGDLAGAAGFFRATLGHEAGGKTSPSRQALLALARLSCERGEYAEALRLCDEHELADGEEGWGVDANNHLGARARALAGLRRGDEARELLGRALHDAEGFGALIHFDRLLDAVAVAARLGDGALRDASEATAARIARQSGAAGLVARYTDLQKRLSAPVSSLGRPR